MAGMQALLEQLHPDAIAAREDDAARKRAIATAEQVISLLETPFERAWRICMIEVAIDLDLYALVDKSGTSKSAGELAAATGADPMLMGRLMRILASRDVFGAEIRNGEVVYSSTTFSQAMLGPTLRGGVTFFHKYNHRIYQGLPAHLKKTGYKDPGNQGIVGPFQAALNTNKSVFHYVQSEDPQSLRGFGHFMTALSTNRPRWFDADLYPVGERLFGADYDPDYDSVLLVDVGGGRGHDLKGFREAFPEAPKGRLILQDRGALLDTVPKDFFAEYQIEAQPHDFFTPQPVQGARCYFFHHIIHDWNDDDCVKILTNIAAVMKKGYSKLLLYEIVLPAVGALAEDCFLDVAMMTYLGSKERTEEEFAELLNRVALKVVHVWRCERGGEGVIEAELV